MDLLSQSDIHDLQSTHDTSEGGSQIMVKESNVADIDIVYSGSPSVREHITQLIIYSNHPDFPSRSGIHHGPERILDLVERATSKECRSILGYTIDGGIEKEYIEGYKHRALYVDPSMQGKGFSEFLHKTMNTLVGRADKEITYVPSLLWFHMQRGFEITKVHVIIEGETTSPSFKVEGSKVDEIKSIIYWCLKNGDLSLPFFVELEYTGKSFEIDGISDDNIPVWLPEIIGFFQQATDNGYRSFFPHEPNIGSGLIRLLGLEAK